MLMTVGADAAKREQPEAGVQRASAGEGSCAAQCSARRPDHAGLRGVPGH